MRSFAYGKSSQKKFIKKRKFAKNYFFKKKTDVTMQNDKQPYKFQNQNLGKTFSFTKGVLLHLQIQQRALQVGVAEREHDRTSSRLL
jgi:hypothetical protein